MANKLPALSTTIPLPILQATLQQALQLPMKDRSYTAQIMRQNPTAFLFLINQSGAMDELAIVASQPTALGSPG